MVKVMHQHLKEEDAAKAPHMSTDSGNRFHFKSVMPELVEDNLKGGAENYKERHINDFFKIKLT
jgi:hypothetical protein